MKPPVGVTLSQEAREALRERLGGDALTADQRRTLTRLLTNEAGRHLHVHGLQHRGQLVSGSVPGLRFRGVHKARGLAEVSR